MTRDKSAMISLPECLAAWGTPRFKAALSDALQQLDPGKLPLQQALAQSSHVSGGPRSVLVQGVEEDKYRIRARVGVFYTGIIAGCNCADDPTPADEVNEYCEMLVEIDKASGAAVITLSE